MTGPATTQEPGRSAPASLKGSPDFARKTLGAVGWALVGAVLGRVVMFAGTLVLARLLDPTSFGLWGIGQVVVVALWQLGELGLFQALVTTRRPLAVAADTAFVISAAFGALCVAGVVLLSPLAASFFDEPQVAPLLIWLSSTMFLLGLGTVPSALLERELLFNRKLVPETGAALAFVFVGIALAVAGLGFWSLIGAQIAYQGARSALLWLQAPIPAGFRYGLKFDLATATELVGLGKYAMASQVGQFIFTTVDNAIVGKLLGPAALGLYSMAYKLALFPAVNVTHHIAFVMFPAFSQVREDAAELRRAFLGATKYTLLLSVPLGLWLMILAPQLIPVLLGAQWTGVVLTLQVLCVYGIARALWGLVVSLVLAFEGQRQLLWINVGVLALALALVFPAAEWAGVVGVAAAFTASQIVGLLALLRLGMPHAGVRARELVGTAVPSLAVIAAGAVVYVPVALGPGTPVAFLPLAAEIIAIGLTSAVGLALVDRATLVRFWNERRARARESALGGAGGSAVAAERSEVGAVGSCS
ncbi:MAG: lipopolysaccharide biosynthesis protein [Chloroflexi bacterium]|nr:lipopolysaccharide biosynthesis protein [Chloroflexota bacterium]